MLSSGHCVTTCRPENTKGGNLIHHPSVHSSVVFVCESPVWIFRFNIPAHFHKTGCFPIKFPDNEERLLVVIYVINSTLPKTTNKQKSPEVLPVLYDLVNVLIR